VPCFCRNFAIKIARTGCTSAIGASSIALGLHRPCPEIKKTITSMNKKSPNNKQDRKHQAAQSYTEEQARLLLAMRDMVKWEVSRQLKEQLKELFK
jgi:hypothetical protein